MTELKVLIEGYARKENSTEDASSTTTLIREGEINIIVDPGMNRDLLLKSLKKEKLSPDKINYVILTHYHLDHSLLTGIFENAKVLDDEGIYSFDGMIKKHDGKVPETNIEIIKTPGHDPFHCSILIETKEGKLIIAGDVFWWYDDEEQKTDKESLINREDPYVRDKGALINSRKLVLEKADYIIPAHGKMFKVEK